MKILIIDDSATVRMLLKRFLLSQGHTVIEAEDGEAGLQEYRLNRGALDVVILDVIMPIINGYEVARIIRESDSTNWIPIVFLSGQAEEVDLVKGIEAGGDDYLFKPINVTILKAKLLAMERIANMRAKIVSMNTELMRLANQDGLTGVANRRLMDDYLARELKRAQRTQLPLSVCLIDVDHFKRFNDNYGHLNGDLCLKGVAEIIQSFTRRPSDLVARYGGEEFVCILPETDRDAAHALAESIRVEIAQSNFTTDSGLLLRVTASIGVSATIPSLGTHSKDIISAADQALYRAKANGRNQVEVSMVVV